jgi:hypothetical protein
METRLRPSRPVMADDDERKHLQALERALVEEEGIGPTIIAPDGGTVPVPQSLNRLFREITHLLAIGNAVRVMSIPSEVTHAVAAELINESETVVRVLILEGCFRQGEGDPSRVRLAGVLAYKDERRQALEELIQLNQELGLYGKS